MAEAKTYARSCRCGTIRYEVTADLSTAIEGINVRCLDGVDLASLKTVQYDGANH